MKSQTKYKAKHDKHCLDHNFQVGDEVRLCVSKEKLRGEKKLKLGKPHLVEDLGENVQIFSIEFFPLEYLKEL